jgi:hypothetical protein
MSAKFGALLEKQNKDNGNDDAKDGPSLLPVYLVLFICFGAIIAVFFYTYTITNTLISTITELKNKELLDVENGLIRRVVIYYQSPLATQDTNRTYVRGTEIILHTQDIIILPTISESITVSVSFNGNVVYRLGDGVDEYPMQCTFETLVNDRSINTTTIGAESSGNHRFTDGILASIRPFFVYNAIGKVPITVGTKLIKLRVKARSSFSGGDIKYSNLSIRITS